jgi:hypothetical protein
LIYADWLEDHGQSERAEFIRVQIALATLPEPDSLRWQGLEARERQLLQEHEQEWAGPPPRIVTEWAFERGFLAGVQILARGFSQLPAVFDDSTRRERTQWAERARRELQR